jgi:hypothetical protein
MYSARLRPPARLRHSDCVQQPASPASTQIDLVYSDPPHRQLRMTPPPDLMYNDCHVDNHLTDDSHDDSPASEQVHACISNLFLFCFFYFLFLPFNFVLLVNSFFFLSFVNPLFFFLWKNGKVVCLPFKRKGTYGNQK